MTTTTVKIIEAIIITIHESNKCNIEEGEYVSQSRGNVEAGNDKLLLKVQNN